MPGIGEGSLPSDVVTGYPTLAGCCLYARPLAEVARVSVVVEGVGINEVGHERYETEKGSLSPERQSSFTR